MDDSLGILSCRRILEGVLHPPGAGMYQSLDQHIRTFVKVPVQLLAKARKIPVPLFMDPGTGGEPVLYSGPGKEYGSARVEALLEDGILFLRGDEEDWDFFQTMMEADIAGLFSSGRILPEVLAEVVHGASYSVAGDILGQGLDEGTLDRAQRVLRYAASFLLSEHIAFRLLRKVLLTHPSRVRHAVNVSLLSMGLGRAFAKGNHAKLEIFGLAGLLHDIGREENEDLRRSWGPAIAVENPKHCLWGAELLQEKGLPESVVLSALQHHEREDGAGYPQGMEGMDIHPVSKVIAIVDAFDDLRSANRGLVSMFDTLRIMRRAFEGCFDEEVRRQFQEMFRLG